MVKLLECQKVKVKILKTVRSIGTYALLLATSVVILLVGLVIFKELLVYESFTLPAQCIYLGVITCWFIYFAWKAFEIIWSNTND